MYQALSLKNGQYVSAERARYDSSRSLLLVCPECGEPVYFKFRQEPNYTYFFAHYKEKESLKLARGCSLRVFGAAVKIASDLIPGLSHGQLVNRFQKEFCSELFQLFSKQSSALSEFIQLSGFHNLDKKDYVDLINQIPTFNLFASIASEVLKSSDTEELLEGLTEVCQFLKSPYGVWVGNYLYQVSYFLACMIHPDTFNKDLATSTYTSGKVTALFVVEPFRLKQSNTFAMEVLSEKSRQNKAIPRICSALVSMLILKWRFPRAVPKLFLMADQVEIDKPGQAKLAEKKPAKLPTNKKKLEAVIPSSPLVKLSPDWLPTGLPLARPYGIQYKPALPIQKEPVEAKMPVKSIWRPVTVDQRKESGFTGKTLSLKPKFKNFSSPLTAEEKKLVNMNRVVDLILKAKNIKLPLNPLNSIGALQNWSQCGEAIDAYFLASYFDLPHEKPADIELQLKIKAWVKWAKSIL